MSRSRINIKLLSAPADPQTVVAMAARLCYSGADVEGLKNKIEEKDQTAFVTRLTDMGHMSPVEHVSFTFGIEGVSRALLAQITRHRIASFSVQSQRYVDQTKGGLDYILPPSIETLGEEAVKKFEEQMNTIAGWYEEWVEALGGGCETSRQDARMVLPNAAETKMLVTMNARELIHFFRLRSCQRAQWEIRALAWAMMGIVEAKCPALFSQSGPGCVGGGCTEGKMSCGLAKEIREKRGALSKFVAENKEKPDFEALVCAWASQNA